MARTFLVLILVVGVRSVTGEEKDAADLLPSSTVIYSEIPAPKRLIDLIFDHPLRARLESLDEYKKAFETPQYTEFQFGLSIVEQQLGMKWRDALEALTEGGIHVAIDAPNYGTVLLVRARDAAILEKAKETLLKLVRDEAGRRGQGDPVRSVDYRGISAYRIEESRFAVLGPWLIVTNKDELGKAIIDGYLDGLANPLKADKEFAVARTASRSKELPLQWSFLRLKALRDAGIAKELFAGKTDNPVAELLVGGIMSTLQKAPYATSAVYGAPNRLRWSLALPYDAAWIPETRQFYFGPKGEGVAAPLLSAKDAILSLSTYRDLSGLWTAAADLFDANVNAQLAQANSGLTTLFAGRDFGIDVLGSVRPEMQLVVSRQTFDQPNQTPEIKLPSLAIVFRLKDPEKMQRQWKVTFQSLIGFLNVVGSMNGQPPLELDIEKLDGFQLVSANYLPKENDDNKPVPINFNASPTVSFVHDLFVVSTTRQLAVELSRSAKDQGRREGDSGRTNTQMSLNISALRDALSDNSQHLVAQNMLQKGHGKENAEKEIGTLLDLLKAVKDFSVQLDRTGDQLRLSFDLQLAP